VTALDATPDGAPRAWLCVPADDDTVGLVAEVLEAGAESRRRAALLIAEELQTERRAGKDIRSGAVKLAGVMAEASVLARVATDVRAGDLPTVEYGSGVVTAGDLAIGAAVQHLAGVGGPEPVMVASTPTGRQVVTEDGRTAWVAPNVDELLGDDDGAPGDEPAEVAPIDVEAG
jgi:hypothetical protein